MTEIIASAAIRAVAKLKTSAEMTQRPRPDGSPHRPTSLDDKWDAMILAARAVLGRSPPAPVFPVGRIVTVKPKQKRRGASLGGAATMAIKGSRIVSAKPPRKSR
jgi:hypothetical protein